MKRADESTSQSAPGGEMRRGETSGSVTQKTEKGDEKLQMCDFQFNVLEVSKQNKKYLQKIQY